MPQDDGRFIGTILTVVLIVACAMFVLLFGWGLFTASVPAGHVGVQETFGAVDNNLLQPGFHLKAPWVGVHMISLQTQKYMDYGSSDTATITALSNDGLSTSMGIAVNYHLNEAKVVELYKRVGTDYSNVVMVNPIHSVPRDMISKYDTKTLYSASQAGTTDRAKLEQELYEGIQSKLETVGVTDSIAVEQVYIRNIDFPDAYKNTITAKMNMDTEIATKRSELEKQRIEAERVVVVAEADAAANIARAKGEAEANRIRTESLSDILLKYTWIQSMKENPKAIYISVDETGMPTLIRNVDSS
jgi:regulator of protease activity HflC (stomatin/prohibitin superfamily)